MATPSELLRGTASYEAPPVPVHPRLRGAASAGAGGLAALGALSWQSVAIADWVAANPLALLVGDALVVRWAAVLGGTWPIMGLVAGNVLLALELLWQTRAGTVALPLQRIALGTLAAVGIAAAVPPAIVCLILVLNLALWAALIALCTGVLVLWLATGLLARLLR